MRNCWIRKTWEYQRVYREGIKGVGKRLVVYVLPREGETLRFGITVSRKIGGAVVRNRVRRRLRQVVRKNFKDWNGTMDTVIVARKAIVPSTFQEIETEFLQILQRISRKLSLPTLPVKSDR